MTKKQINKIVALRRKRGLTQGELARRARVSRQTIVGIERGFTTQKNPRLDTLRRIADVLQIEIMELI